MTTYRRIAQLRTAADLRAYLDQLGIALPFDDTLESGAGAPLAQPHHVYDVTIGNRFAILPMEGWDGTTDGMPTDLVRRRWTNFGISGAKLIWGCEAVAVRPDGRANPNQLMLNADTLPALSALRDTLVRAHAERFGTADDLYVGLQLTHSGRFARPLDKKRLDPKILYAHPILNRRFGLPDDYPVLRDDEIDALVEDFVRAAVLAQRAGFQFVDIKHCHGYLGHEFLSAVTREGRYGGSFENRTRFLRAVVTGIRAAAPALRVGVRVSAFDWLPFRKGAGDVGEPEPMPEGGYPFAFGGGRDGVSVDLRETFALMELLRSLDVQLVCVTAGSPYYNPHIQRPALFPPSDGYQPPEDPLVGVARQIDVVAQLKARFPDLTLVGSGYSYLQEWLPHVAQRVVRDGMADFVGLGRMVLSYPDLPADVLAGAELQRKRICRTFSDCTTAPRNGMVSGCYPLDPFYKQRPEAQALVALKQQ